MKKIKTIVTLGLTMFCLVGCHTNQKIETSVVQPLVETEIISETAHEEINTTEETTTVIEQFTTEVYYVYKPSTHYIHKSTCDWVDNTCYRISDTMNIDAIICTDCNPELEVYHPYTNNVQNDENLILIEDYTKQLLAEITYHEAGSDWISLYDKARVVSAVWERVCDLRFPCTVYDVLTQEGQFEGYWPGCCTPTPECYDAVDYYFSHMNDFDDCNSWYGDGYQNYFYYQ